MSAPSARLIAAAGVDRVQRAALAGEHGLRPSRRRGSGPRTTCRSRWRIRSRKSSGSIVRAQPSPGTSTAATGCCRRVERRRERADHAAPGRWQRDPRSAVAEQRDGAPVGVERAHADQRHDVGSGLDTAPRVRRERGREHRARGRVVARGDDHGDAARRRARQRVRAASGRTLRRRAARGSSRARATRCRWPDQVAGLLGHVWRCSRRVSELSSSPSATTPSLDITRTARMSASGHRLADQAGDERAVPGVGIEHALVDSSRTPVCSGSVAGSVMPIGCPPGIRRRSGMRRTIFLRSHGWDPAPVSSTATTGRRPAEVAPDVQARGRSS